MFFGGIISERIVRGVVAPQPFCYNAFHMCLAIPGKIESIDGRTAVVDFSGIKRKADLSFLPDARTSDWVLVHVGFAIQKVQEDVARETYRLLDDSRREELENELRRK